MAKRTKSRLEVHYLSLTRPISRDEIEQRLREVIQNAKDGKEAGEEVAEEIIIKIALVSADRLKAYDRLEAQDVAKDWIMEALGKTALEMVDVLVEDLDATVRRTWISMLEAADILGALVPGECENWSPPGKLEEWAYIPDYIFDPLLDEARRLNPQWAIQAGINLGNLTPGSQSNGDGGTSD